MRKLRGSGLFLLILATLALPACAGGSGMATTQKGSLIRMEVVGPQGPPIKSIIEEGSFLRLQDNASGRALAFKPDVHTSPAKVQVYQIEKGTDGAESLRLLDEAEVKIGSAESKTVAKVYSVRILEVIHPA